jgi:hypothetical protein
MNSPHLALVIVLTIGAMICFSWLVLRFFHNSTDGPEPIEHGDLQDVGRWGRAEDDDHPDDVERQGSHLVPQVSGWPFTGRRYENRYDGIADKDEAG